VRIACSASLLLLAGCGEEDFGRGPASDGGPDSGAGGDAGTDAGGPDCEGRYAGAPTSRGDHVSVWSDAPGELVVFGGDDGVPEACAPAPSYVDELWVFETDCGTWRQIEGASGPGPLARASAVLDSARNRMVLFGGRSQAGGGAYDQHDDVWALDLDALSWTEVATSGTGPSGRSNAVAVVDEPGDRMIVFGGNTSASGASFAPTADAFALDLETHEWSQVGPGDGPPARLFHAAAATPDAMIVHAGGDENAFFGPFLSDLWRLDLATDTWEEISATGGPPDARISGALVSHAGTDSIALFGGHDDGVLGNRNDLWRLDVTDATWSAVGSGDVLDNTDVGFCDFPADFTTQDLAFPERRSASTLAADGAGSAWLFGGKTDCGLANDVWRLDLATGAWTEVRVANQGLSCERQGRIGCTSYCL